MMTDSPHSLGPNCRLAPVALPPWDDALDGIPPLKAQFFYSSPIPLDDPLSTPTIIGTTDAKAHAPPLRPFSPADNNALEKAWIALGSDSCRENHAAARHDLSQSLALSQENAAKLDAIVARLVNKHKLKHNREGQQATLATDTQPGLPKDTAPMCCAELMIDVLADLRTEFCALVRKRQQFLNQDAVIEAVMTSLDRLRTGTGESDVLMPAKQFSADGASNVAVPGTRYAGMGERSHAASVTRSEATPVLTVPSTGILKVGQIRPSPADDGISGMPFVRVGAGNASQVGTHGGSLSHLSSAACQGPLYHDASIVDVPHPQGVQMMDSWDAGKHDRSGETVSLEGPADIPVGVSRLHMVSLPSLQMKPIYWSPVNDMSIVLRATWFYKDGMVPVEPAVANQLESGYRDLRAWSETWADELRSALEVGALGEEKVSHPLWPEPIERRPKSRKAPPPEPLISSDPFCAARCYRGEASAAGTLEAVLPGDNADVDLKPYRNYDVIYKDANAAFLLKQSLKPSAYYGRRPVAKILRGNIVGVPVIRGFDWHLWDSVHNKRRPQDRPAPGPRSPDATAPSLSDTCPGCDREQERGRITDLVLVAHGIGQKLAERVESFHFTHAINAFRRAVNVELGNETVKSVLHSSQNGIMVLPVNWRHVLEFEEGGPTRDKDQIVSAVDGFALRDIEPSTIPAVRSMISDVMFDIPFYLSHQHRPRMIAALVAEANRIYRLWCQNNPGFSAKGRVHVIAHSLGSVMAIEVLSKQPTTVPPIDLTRELPRSDRFEFDTKNLFLLGSPAGFFLLLEKGKLIPRRGRFKPGADRGDVLDDDVVGEMGMFGCLAVDNIYNILAKEDPIAYLLNATIDPKYASSLKTAYVPSSQTSILQSIGNTLRGLTGHVSDVSTATDTAAMKPSIARLPSQLELEVHDFTREDIAVKKAYLLNDNGQIDYFLRSGGGPLEIQYLNMLSAHTSYWYSQDLIRMLCIEIGRQPGRKTTLRSMRAVKAATQRILPTTTAQ